MIENLIKEGHKLLERLEREFDGRWRDFPPAERVSHAELNAWYRGIQLAVDSEFGPESSAAKALRSKRRNGGQRVDFCAPTSTLLKSEQLRME